MQHIISSVPSGIYISFVYCI